MTRLFTELKRRHVYRVAVAYAVTAWLLLQIAAIVLPTFGAPHWVMKVLIGVFVAGFPVAVLLAWAFEATPEGVRRTEPAEAEAARTSALRRRVGRRIDFVIIAFLLAAVGILAWRLSAKPGSAREAKSVAVLPFTNDSGDPKQQYFSDGLSESLIVALSQYPVLFVIGRDSSFQLRNTTLDSKQIGAKLGVANLLEGSVSREGDEVRIRAELVHAADGRTEWSEQYDRPYKNLFALQDAITKAVATALKAKLLGNKKPGAVVQTDRPPSGSLAAYNAYLEGNFYITQPSEDSFRQAIAAYQRAIAADPKYAAAYAGLSYAWSSLGPAFLSGPALTQALAKARSAANTALKLDPDSAVAFTARGWLALITLDWQRAEAAFQRALTLAPASPGAMRLSAASLAAVGRLDSAIPLGRKAVAANPLDARAYLDLSHYLAGANKLDASMQAVKRALALRPAAAEFHAWLAVIEILRGHPQAALKTAKAEPDPFWRTWALALAYQAAGDKAQADRTLQALVTKDANDAAYQIAEVYAYRRDTDQTFAWLDRAWRQHDGGIGLLLYDPLLLRYKDDPRFAAFCRKVGLPVPGSAATPATATGTDAGGNNL